LAFSFSDFNLSLTLKKSPRLDSTNLLTHVNQDLLQ
jgi:hypothetical protein